MKTNVNKKMGRKYQTMMCNYCGSVEHIIITRYTRFEKNNVLQCKNCGLVYLETKKDKKEIESFYSSSTYRNIPTSPKQSPEEHFYDKVTIHDIEDRIKFISNNIKIKNKKILEIGSASGGLLKKIQEYGAKEVIGIELDEAYAKFSQKNGQNISTTSIEELNYKNEFDTIVTFHTLEHVYNPKAVFKSIYIALKKNGCFLGEVPNQNDWRMQIFDDEVVKRFHYDPTHYYYYSPTTLRNYLEKSGFTKDSPKKDNIQLETVERYNSLRQLKNILCNKKDEKNVEKNLRKHIFPKNKKDEVRLPDINDRMEHTFNRIFEIAVNSELMGNCLRWLACK
jgi:2-polyprenyl-3-methyl-5-hydroxy-6-metoxy-1,4-benzoquinol methylase